MFDRQKMKSFAKMQLKERWTVPVLITLLTVIISSIFNLQNIVYFSVNDLKAAVQNGDFVNFYYQTILENMQSRTIGTTILQILKTLIDFIFSIAIIKFYFVMAKSPEPVTFSTFFQGFNFWARGLLCGLWKFLWLFLWVLLVIPFTIVAGFIGGISGASSGSFEAVTEISLILITLAITVILIIKILQYSMMDYLVAEYDELGIMKALNLSKLITKGYKWNLFVLYLSFLGWIILSLLTLGILSLWVTPYINMTMVNTYHSILQEAFDKQIIHPEDFDEE